MVPVTSKLCSPLQHSMTESARQLQQRAAVYRLLADLWGRELSLTSVETLQRPQIRKIWLAAGGADPDCLSSRLTDLTEDYCRFFIGPVAHLPPLQSVWSQGELQSDVVRQLVEFSRLCDYKSKWPELLPDHLANELLLMAVLLEKATLESDPMRADLAEHLAATFLEQHLNWPQRFFERIESLDSGGFYGSLATLTRSFLDTETRMYPRIDQSSEFVDK